MDRGNDLGGTFGPMFTTLVAGNLGTPFNLFDMWTNDV